MASTIIIIPAFNEDAHIFSLVKECRKFVDTVIVVDDCSVDSTFILAEKAGAVVFKNPANIGNSATLIKGFVQALDRDVENIITIDGDMAHNPDEIPKFLTEAVDNDIVIGNRFHSARGEIPSQKIHSNIFAAELFNLASSKNFEDVTCGFRLIKATLVRDFLITSKPEGFSLAYDMLYFAATNNYKIAFQPIEVRYDATELFSTKQKELIDFLSSIIKFSCDSKVVTNTTRLRNDVLNFNPATVYFKEHTFCLLPLENHGAYLLQKQSIAFNNNIGSTYDFLI